MKRRYIVLVVAVIIVGLFLVDGGSVYVKQLLNRPPKATFSFRTPTRTLKYIAPTDRDIIMFLNNSTDPDGDPLTSQWFIRYNGTGEWKLLNTSRDHWGRLPVSNEKGHEVKLVVSDGVKEDTAATILPVDHAYFPQYQSKRLRIAVKGINYYIYRPFEGSPPLEDEMEESLTVIREDLRCNGIRIAGGYDDAIIKCARIAEKKRFDIISLSPRYRKMNATADMDIEEHIRKVIDFSRRAEDLRRTSSANIVLIVGNELSIDVRGILEAPTYGQRIEKIKTWNNELNSKLNTRLNYLINEVRKNFKGDITYAAGSWEDIDWGQPNINIVGPNQYVYSSPSARRWALDRIAYYKRFGKPFWVSEFGCKSYLGASQQEPYRGQPYSQEDQATNIADSIDVFEKAGGVDAVFLFVFAFRMEEGGLPDDANSYGIMRYFGWEKPMKRKLGFYAY